MLASKKYQNNDRSRKLFANPPNFLAMASLRKSTPPEPCPDGKKFRI
jgi:hypothetical protein